MPSSSTSSSSAAAAHASVTPRALGRAGRWNTAQPALSAKPSAFAASASRAPPPPPEPDQISTARSDARNRLPSLLDGASSRRAPRRPRPAGAGTVPRAPIVTISAPDLRLPEPEVDHGGTVDDVVVADDDDELGVADGRKRALNASSAVEVASSITAVRAEPRRRSTARP